VQQLGGGQALAQEAGAEGQIVGLHLDRVSLSCPEANLDHLEPNQNRLEQLWIRKKGKIISEM
jgi:hypothetical protein